MNKRKIKAFTLIEIIIVVTILSILALISFISFRGFIKDSRDANRVSTIKNIEKGLELYALKTTFFPKVTKEIKNGNLSGTTLIEQWIIDDEIAHAIGLNTIPLDPKTKHHYTYSVYDKKQYQIASILETDLVYIPWIEQAYAKNTFAKVSGNYKWYVKFHDGTCESYINIPSLVWNNNTDVDLLNQDTYYIVDKWENIPYWETNLWELKANEIVKFQRNFASNATFKKVCREDLEQIVKDEFADTDEENTILASFWVSKEWVATIILWDKSLSQYASCWTTPHGWKKNFWSVNSVWTWYSCPDPVSYTCDKWIWKEEAEIKDISWLFETCISADNNCKLTDEWGWIILWDNTQNCLLF